MGGLLVVVDVESDGPCPPLYSMVSFGAVVVEAALDRTFYGRTAPISSSFLHAALNVSGTTRAQHMTFEPPAEVMARFRTWLLGLGGERLVLVSDNPAFDAAWINYYFHAFAPPDLPIEARNPFGHSARRIGDVWAGLSGKFGDHTSWKSLKRTPHTHHPVDDAMGNAEALLEIMRRLGEAR